ncbi:MAG: MBL fold metallo-hydrolase [Thermoanaerobaculia bacterium]
MSRKRFLAIRVLGPYGGSAPGYRLTTFLVNGESALDAGALTDTLPLAAQRRIRRVFLTHAHFDHIASLPFLAANLHGSLSAPIEILAPEPVLEAVRRHVFNDTTWPDFTRFPSVARPTIRYRPLAEGRAFSSGGFSVTPYAVNHVVPAYGYVVASNDASVVFSGDTGPTERLWGAARRARQVRGIFLECSFSDREEKLAADSLHLTPRLVAQELPKLPQRAPVYLYHVKPFSLARIRRELEALREPRLHLLEEERSFRF